jgi:extradiol dioxygenase family protein
MTLKIRLLNEIEAPEGTVVIRNDSWLTFARRTESGNYKVFTIPTVDFEYNLKEESKWTEFTKNELQKILKVK